MKKILKTYGVYVGLAIGLLALASPLVAQQIVEYAGHLVFRPHHPEIRWVGDLKLRGVAGATVSDRIYLSSTTPKILGKTDHLLLDTDSDSKVVRINSRNYSATTGSFIGFQSKPAATVSKTSDGIIGGEVSPRVNNGIALAGASGTVIGLHVDSYLRGTSAGTIGGDVRALQLELVTDDAGTRTISGNVNAIRIRSAFSATTISGTFVPIRIEKAETQTNSKQYDAVLDLPSTNGAVWDVKGSDYSPANPRAKIKVLINGTAYWLVAYSTEPT